MMRSILVIAALGLAGSALAQEAPKAASTCVACHGDKGAKPILPDYPILAGQYANYLEHALHEYKAGKRKNPVMSAQAAQLSADDIEALAEYFSLQESPLYIPRITAAEKK